MLRIHNSLTGQVEPLEPLEPPQVRMYVCGITVYDFCHLGHARMFLVFDIVARYLRYRGYDLTYVRNITDIDDKIILRAADNGEAIDELTDRFIDAMNEDCAALGLITPDAEPRATGHVPEIVEMIEKLVERGHAYVANDGDVNYSVSSFSGYGQLSGKRLEDLRAGARVDVSAGKRDPLDFVLWKAAKPGEPSWPSPWGPGRPGWHIECSAMSTALLGEHFDIHGGGMDLKFPHHENEIAQSCGASDAGFVNLWMHNGFVRVDEEKMSKSLGNFFEIREVLREFKPEVVRFFMLSSHYRSPVNYSDGNLQQAAACVDGLYAAIRGIEASSAIDDGWQERFVAAMDDDFNTPEAIAVIQELRRETNVARDAGKDELAQRLSGTLIHLGQVLGLMGDDPEHYFRTAPGWAGLYTEAGSGEDFDSAEIEQLIADRKDARKRGDYSRADGIRDDLEARGIVLEDGAGGTTWRRK